MRQETLLKEQITSLICYSADILKPPEEASHALRKFYQALGKVSAAPECLRSHLALLGLILRRLVISGVDSVAKKFGGPEESSDINDFLMTKD